MGLGICSQFGRIYNTTNLSTSLLGPYCGHQIGIYKCPGDTRPGALGTRVRSVSMNAYMAGYSSDSTITGLMAGYQNFQKYSAIISPAAPSDAFVFVDEQADSINDGFLLVAMANNNVSLGQTGVWYDRPAGYHGQSGNLSFADGHAESRLWHDPQIANDPVIGVNPAPYTQFPSSVAAGDLAWVQMHATSAQ